MNKLENNETPEITQSEKLTRLEKDISPALEQVKSLWEKIPAEDTAFLDKIEKAYFESKLPGKSLGEKGELLTRVENKKKEINEINSGERMSALSTSSLKEFNDRLEKVVKSNDAEEVKESAKYLFSRLIKMSDSLYNNREDVRKLFYSVVGVSYVKAGYGEGSITKVLEDMLTEKRNRDRNFLDHTAKLFDDVNFAVNEIAIGSLSRLKNTKEQKDQIESVI